MILEAEHYAQRTPSNVENIYVRSEGSGELIPRSNLVRLEEFANHLRDAGKSFRDASLRTAVSYAG